MSLYVTVTMVLFAVSLAGQVCRGYVNGWTTALALDAITCSVLITWAMTL